MLAFSNENSIIPETSMHSQHRYTTHYSILLPPVTITDQPQ